MKRALVLAGGGVVGIAWELGVLRGIQDIDPDLESSLVAADVIVGTSAGSAVAGQITSGTALEDLYAAQLAERSSEIEVDFDMDGLVALLVSATAGAATAEEIRRRVGAVALTAPTVEESARRGHTSALGQPGPGDRAAATGRRAGGLCRRSLTDRLRHEPAVGCHPRPIRASRTGDRPGPGRRPGAILALAVRPQRCTG